MKKKYILVFVFLIVSCSTFNKSDNYSAFEDGYDDSSRAPSSISNPLNVALLKDFVVLDSYKKNVHYQMQTSVWTNKDSKYLRKKMKKVIQKTMHDVLLDFGSSAEKEKPTLKKSLKKHLVAHLLNEFIKTIFFYKITSGTFQFDISIVPMKDSTTSFKNELSSNQLIKFSTNSLSHFIKEKNYGLPEKISRIDFPKKNDAQFLGGNISIAFKLLDFDINPLSPIPNPKKNAVKGEIVYRKYMRKNSREIRSIRDKDVSLKSGRIKDGNSQYMTVDYIYHFNLGEIIPKIKEVNIFPGVLKGRGHYKSGMLSYINSILFKKEKSIKGKHWKIFGTVREKESSEDFVLSLNRLSFVPDLNEYKVFGNIDMLSNVQDVTEMAGFDLKGIIEKNGSELIESLGITSLISSVVQEEK